MKQQQVEWRRAKVLELSSRGYSEREIAEKLQPQDTLQKYIHEVVPEEYQKCMVGDEAQSKACPRDW